VSDDHIESLFPNLQRNNYVVTSPTTAEYNCIAWAASDTDAWWEPDALFLSFWPDGVPRQYSLDSYIGAFMALGYTVCQGSEYENGYEKIALYIDQNKKPTHAARQLSSGHWTSKLGQLEDIEYNTLEGLIGTEYGTVTVIMKRPRKK